MSDADDRAAGAVASARGALARRLAEDDDDGFKNVSGDDSSEGSSDGVDDEDDDVAALPSASRKKPPPQQQQQKKQQQQRSLIEESSDSDAESDEDVVDIMEDGDFLGNDDDEGASAADAARERERQDLVRSKFDVLCQVPFFARFPREHQERLFSELQVEHYRDGDRIVTQGEQGDRMYVIVSGEAVVWREDVGDITHLYTHDYFGEQALVYGQERNSNVSAIGDATVMYLSKEVFDKYRDIRVFMVVQKIPLLSKLRPDMQQTIVELLRPLAFKQGELVIQQGESGDAFFMIMKGAAEVVENGEVTTHLYEGHTFGQMALLSGAPRLASVRASEPLIVMELKARDFQALIAENEDFNALLQVDDQAIRRRRSKRDARRKRTAGGGGLGSRGGTFLSGSSGTQTRAGRASSGDVSQGGFSRRSSAESGVTVGSPTTMQSTLSRGRMIEKKVVDARRKGGLRVVNGFELQREIGRGTFGKVRLCVHEDTGEQFAIKIIDKSKFKENVSVHAVGLEEMRQEVAIMKRLRHPHIVNLVAVIDDPEADHLYIVTEFCERGAIMDGLEGNEPLPEATARQYFRDLLLGLQYLHFQGVIHRDIKPMNLLLTADDVLKIADFGAARIVTGGARWISGVTGTPAFMAPELLVEDSDVYDGPAVDLWSCGATLYMLVSGRPPWMSSDEIRLAKKVKNDELLFPDDWNQRNYSPYLKNLITQLLVKDPRKRPTLEAVMEHDWVTEEGSEMLPQQDLLGLLAPVADDEEAEAPATGPATDGGSSSGAAAAGAAAVGSLGALGSARSHVAAKLEAGLTQAERDGAIDRLEKRGSVLTMSSLGSDMASPKSGGRGTPVKQPLGKQERARGGRRRKEQQDLDELLAPDAVVEDEDGALDDDDDEDEDDDLDEEDEMYSREGAKYDIGRLNLRHRARNAGDGSRPGTAASGRSDAGASAGEQPFELPHGLKGGKRVVWVDVRYASHKEQGKRATMEDTLCVCSKLTRPGGESWFSGSGRGAPVFFAGVYDGHGGDLAALALKESLHRTVAAQEAFPEDLHVALEHGFLAADREMLARAASAVLAHKRKVSAGEERHGLLRTKGDRGRDASLVDAYQKSGSTAVLLLVSHDKKDSSDRVLTCAWVGDSRGVLCRGGKAVPLSEDHKAARADEALRIRNAGGTVSRKGLVDGTLAVSRAFGDLMHKGVDIERLAAMKPEGVSPEDDDVLAAGAVTAKPDVTRVALRAGDAFAILATDGLWDVMTNQEAVDFVAAQLLAHKDLQRATEALVRRAEETSVDNVTAVVVALKAS